MSASGFSPSLMTADDQSANVTIVGSGLDQVSAVHLESGSSCSSNGAGVLLSGGSQVDEQGEKLVVSVGGSGISTTGPHSVCVRFGGPGNHFVKAGSGEVTVVARSLDEFSPGIISAERAESEIVIRGKGLSTSFDVAVENGTVCSAKGDALDRVELDGTKSVNSIGTELTVEVGNSDVTAGEYSLCVQMNSGSWRKVGSEQLVVEQREASSFVPEVAPAFDGNARVTIVGAGLQDFFLVQLQDGATCTSGGSAAPVVGVQNEKQELVFRIGGDGLSNGTYSVCVKFDDIADFEKVSGQELELGMFLVSFFFFFGFSLVGLFSCLLFGLRVLHCWRNIDC